MIIHLQVVSELCQYLQTLFRNESPSEIFQDLFEKTRPHYRPFFPKRFYHSQSLFQSTQCLNEYYSDREKDQKYFECLLLIF